MIIVLFALGAMGCASFLFLLGATWAAWPRLRGTNAQENRGATFVSSASPHAEREGMTLAS